jgi:hypothetical protein
LIRVASFKDPDMALNSVSYTKTTDLDSKSTCRVVVSKRRPHSAADRRWMALTLRDEVAEYPYDFEAIIEDLELVLEGLAEQLIRRKGAFEHVAGKVLLLPQTTRPCAVVADIRKILASTFEATTSDHQIVPLGSR